MGSTGLLNSINYKLRLIKFWYLNSAKYLIVLNSITLFKMIFLGLVINLWPYTSGHIRS